MATETIVMWVFLFILLGFVVSIFFRTMRYAAKFFVLGVILFVVLKIFGIHLTPFWW